MEQAQQFIEKYAKKIFGFAYDKTGNTHDAEELASEIVEVFCAGRVWEKDIRYMDAYVYRVCQYTWSNHVRKNKNHWRSLNNAGLELVASESQPEMDFIREEEVRQLRQEIQYLSETRRKILIAYYYDNQKGSEIAEALSIPAATVRWHLQQTKSSLKERMEMTENKIYELIALNIGHCGWANSPIFDELRHDILTQNICWIAREKPVTVEEIARTLGVAAVYLEHKIQQLMSIDYMKKVGPNKYQTNFFIRDDVFQLAGERFRYEKAIELVLPMYRMVKEHLSELKKLGGLPEENDNFLLWALLPGIISGICDTAEEFCRGKHISGEPPKRPDGSVHWLMAFTRYRDAISEREAETDDFKDYCLHGEVWGIKTRFAGKLTSLQYDFQCFGAWRDFDQPELLELGQIRTLLMEGREPSAHEKEMIAGLVQKGYVVMENGKPRIAIPFFTGNAVKAYLTQIAPDYIQKETVLAAYEEFMAYTGPKIPGYVSDEERDFISSAFQPEAAMMYVLYQNGYLQEPEEEEKKRICTLIWES